MYDFGFRLRDLRKRRKLTQKDLAIRISKSKAAISSYENDAQIPPLDVLVSIADVLHTSLDSLVDSSREPCYSVQGLNDEQKSIIELLFAEFSKPTNKGDTLSPQQIKILQDLIHIFSFQQ